MSYSIDVLKKFKAEHRGSIYLADFNKEIYELIKQAIAEGRIVFIRKTTK